VTTKLAELAPPATCVKAGTISALGKLLVSAIPVELAAVWERVTVQLAEVAAVRVVLSHCSAEMPGVPVVLAALTAICSVLVDAPNAALRVAIWSAPTDPAAVMAKFAKLAPAPTCTDDGTISAAGRLLPSVIPAELEAVWESVTVQFAEAPAVSVVLSHCSAEMPGVVIVPAAFTVIDSELLDAPMLALSVAIWSAPTDPAAVTTKLAELAPAGTCTNAGTISALGRLLDSAIPVELVAVCGSVTVQLAEVAAASVVLSHCSEIDCVNAVNRNPKLADAPPRVADTVAG